MERLQGVNTLEDPVDNVDQGVDVNVNVKGLKDFSTEDLLQALKDKQELTVEVNDALMARIPSSDLLYALKGTHPDGLAGYLDHIDMEDIIKYVQEQDPKHLKEPRKASPSRLLDTALISNKRQCAKEKVVVKAKVTRTSTRKRKANS
jgi:hypothetical protein